MVQFGKVSSCSVLPVSIVAFISFHCSFLGLLFVLLFGVWNVWIFFFFRSDTEDAPCFPAEDSSFKWSITVSVITLRVL